MTKSSLDVSSWDENDKSTWKGDLTVRDVVFAAYGSDDSHIQCCSYSKGSATSVLSLKNNETYTVFAIANMGDIRDELPARLEDMPSWRIGVSSFAELERGALPMAGRIDGVRTASGNASVPLQMLCHRLVLNIQNTSGFRLKSVAIRQSALDMTPFTERSVPVAAGDGDMATDTDVAALNAGGSADFYMFENMRGNLLPSNIDSWMKTPSSLKEEDASMATYVELTMNYDSGDGISGDVVYRFCLGDDVCSNFDVQRAKTKFLTFIPSSDNLYRGNWKVDSRNVEDHRVLLFCADSRNIKLVQGSKDKVMMRIHYNVENPSGYSSSNPPSSLGITSGGKGVKWDFYPSELKQIESLLGLSVVMTRESECEWSLCSEWSMGAGVIPVEIATSDGRIRDRVTVTVVGKIKWDNSSEFSNANPSGQDAYRNWFTVGMKKDLRLSGFTSTGGVTAKVVAVSPDGRAWASVTPASSCDYLDIVDVKHDSKTASVTVGAKRPGVVKIRIDSPSTGQGEDFVVQVAGVDLRCDRNYTGESYAPMLEGSPRSLAIHCYLPGFDSLYGDGVFDNPDMYQTVPASPYGYYDGIIPYRAFDTDSSGTGYWDKYVRPVTKVAYRSGVTTRFLEFRTPWDQGYKPSYDDYGYPCYRYRFLDIPLENELSTTLPYARILIAKMSEPNVNVATRSVYALPFFVPSRSPGYIGLINDWSLFNQSKLSQGYAGNMKILLPVTSYVNLCQDSFSYNNARLVGVPSHDISDANECIEFEYDSGGSIVATLCDNGTHALGRLNLYAQIKNNISGNVRSIYAGYIDVFLHVAVGARVVCDEVSYSLPYTDNYDFPSGMKCYGYGIAMEWMSNLKGKCSLAASIGSSNENSAKYIVNGGQNDETALIHKNVTNDGYYYYRDPRLASSPSSMSVSGFRTLRYYRSTHDGLAPIVLWNAFWNRISRNSMNAGDDVNYILWSAPYNEREDNSGGWCDARWPDAAQLAKYGPEANVKLYRYENNSGMAREQTDGILYYVPSNHDSFVCQTPSSTLSGKGFLVVHDLYQCCPMTRGWLYNYEN